MSFLNTAGSSSGELVKKSVSGFFWRLGSRGVSASRSPSLVAIGRVELAAVLAGVLREGVCGEAKRRSEGEEADQGFFAFAAIADTIGCMGPPPDVTER